MPEKGPINHRVQVENIRVCRVEANQRTQRAGVLDKEIQHLTLVVDRPPEPVFAAADRNHHFIEVPMIARSRPRTADIRRDRWPELQEPPPDRLVGCVNASLGQQFLDIPKA